MKNLDRDPGFLLTVLILLPFMAAATFVYAIDKLWN